MKRYFYALVVAVFATMSLAVTGCSKNDDGEGDKGGTTFSYNDKTMYLRQDDYHIPTVDVSVAKDIMQLNFNLYKSASPLDALHPTVGVSIELEPFDHTALSKGTALKMKSEPYGRYSTYTCVTYYNDMLNPASNDYYYMLTSGTMTFEGYDADKNILTVKLSNVQLKANSGETCKLNGRVNCDYCYPGGLTQFSGDFYQ